MNWIKLEKGYEGENQLEELGLKSGLPFLGYSSSWEDKDFNPEGIRECFYTDHAGITSARWNASHDCWINEENSQPDYICLYKKPKL